MLRAQHLVELQRVRMGIPIHNWVTRFLEAIREQVHHGVKLNLVVPPMDMIVMVIVGAIQKHHLVVMAITVAVPPFRIMTNNFVVRAVFKI